MVDIVVEHSFDHAAPHGFARDMSATFERHGVQRVESYVAVDRRRMIYWLHAPDLDTVGLALDQAGATADALWSATIRQTAATKRANVVAEGHCDSAGVSVDDSLNTLNEAGRLCVLTHGVELVRAFVAYDSGRILALYAAPDAESVRLARRHGGLSLGKIWAIQRRPSL